MTTEDPPSTEELAADLVLRQLSDAADPLGDSISSDPQLEQSVSAMSAAAAAIVFSAQQRAAPPAPPFVVTPHAQDLA